jgi:hypothetical protein
MIGGVEEDRFRETGTDMMAMTTQKDPSPMAMKGRRAGRL